MKKIYQYILMVVAMLATTSCNNEPDGVLLPDYNSNLQFVVSEFPMFNESSASRTIGTEDSGKTGWVSGDKLLLSITFKSGKSQGYTLYYSTGVWVLRESIHRPTDISQVMVVYAPDHEIKSDGSIGIVEEKQYGLAEYIPAKTEVNNIYVKIEFETTSREYSRLRIAGQANQMLTVTTTGFTPIGTNDEATKPYTLTTDSNGNAYLYGTFAKDATVTVKQGETEVKSYTFTTETKNGKSYVLDARSIIDGTSDGKTTASKSDVNDLFKRFKDYANKKK